MDEKEKNQGEFSLEDIMREFGAVIPTSVKEPEVSQPVSQKPEPEEVPAPPEKEVPAPAPQPEPEAEPADDMNGDTIRLPDPAGAEAPEPIHEEPAEELESTRKFDAIHKDATVRLNNICEAVKDTSPLDMTETAEPAQETVEPFSENWEPEYEQPIGEYVPPQPILFHPRSRLRN